MTSPERPLSPHLSIYRWPITMTLSILHRVSGVVMTVGLAAFAWWLLELASGEPQYLRFSDLASTPIGQISLLGWLAAFFYHLANGIRHLVWDLGYGFELKTANASAWFVLLLTVILTAGYWIAL